MPLSQVIHSRACSLETTLSGDPNVCISAQFSLTLTAYNCAPTGSDTIQAMLHYQHTSHDNTQSNKLNPLRDEHLVYLRGDELCTKITVFVAKCNNHLPLSSQDTTATRALQIDWIYCSSKYHILVFLRCCDPYCAVAISCVLP